MLIPLNRKMRPVRYGAEVGGSNLMEKRSTDLGVWDEWEIHCLILVSLFLQVLLFLTADLRRRSASRALSTVVWLAYLSADTVAVFVLGHLAVHAQGPNHELMLFWAPFVLVHLGGQDSITAFSKQDNELWTRHLLGLVTQTAGAGYVVSKSSWPNARLRAAMVLMFLCGFLKYAGRTYCLYSASPKTLRASSMGILSDTLSRLQDNKVKGVDHATDRRWMFDADYCLKLMNNRTRIMRWLLDDIMLLDAPVDNWEVTVAADKLSDSPQEAENMPDRCIVYQYVAACLVESYQVLYTKAPLFAVLSIFLDVVTVCCCGHTSENLIVIPVLLTYNLFQCMSAAIALVLFVSAHKEGHHSKADITVSYILLVGAIVLDLLPTFTSIFSFARTPAFRHGRLYECFECLVMSGNTSLLPASWLTRKRWSEELAQYSMTRRYSTSVEDYHTSIRKWILNCKPLFGATCVELFDLTRTPVTDDLKLFILDKLLFLQTKRKEWDFASFRGERALGKWMASRHQVTELAERSSYDALRKSLSRRVEFPASVLIWHIATDICYFPSGDKRIGTEPADETKKKMVISRELSHYIMYLVFKCDVMLTSNSRLVHKKVHEQLTEYFPQVHLDEKETVIIMFKSMKKEDQQQGSMQGVSQETKTNDEAPANRDDATTSSGSGTQEELLQRTVEALYSPVLPLARDVAQELIGIDDEAQRWELISEVWLEMLFYTAPRCGAAFHYEHLSTGGEFITHVLLLMRLLGPFMPKPGP